MTFQNAIAIAHCKIQLQNTYEIFTKKLELTIKSLEVE